MTLSATYLEENVEGVNYELKKHQYEDIWDTENLDRLTNKMQIF